MTVKNLFENTHHITFLNLFQCIKSHIVGTKATPWFIYVFTSRMCIYRVRLHRSDSPETAITERTNTNQSSVYKDGLVLTPQPFVHIAEPHAQHR